MSLKAATADENSALSEVAVHRSALELNGGAKRMTLSEKEVGEVLPAFQLQPSEISTVVAKVKAEEESSVLAQSSSKTRANEAEKEDPPSRFRLYKFVEQAGSGIVFDTYGFEKGMGYVEYPVAVGEKPAGFETWNAKVMVSGVQFYSPAPARRCLRVPTLDAHNLCRTSSARRIGPLRRRRRTW